MTDQTPPTQYGPQPAPDDYRIANRPGNPNRHGVKAWFADAAKNIAPGKSLVMRATRAAGTPRPLDAAENDNRLSESEHQHADDANAHRS